MTTARVRRADPAESDSVFGTLLLAFGNDPIMRWLFPESNTYLRVFPNLSRSFAGNAFEHSAAWTSEGFGGAALWLPEGVSPDSEAMARTLFEAVDEALVNEAVPFFEQMEAGHPTEPHWYLPIIGVDPACQGSGIGSALLAASLEPVDASGLPAYLESSNLRNVPLYQRFGFEAMGEIQAGSSPPMIPMWREARR